MVIIEKVRNIIRPVRLTANIIAGHLLILIDCRLLNAISNIFIKMLFNFLLNLFYYFNFNLSYYVIKLGPLKNLRTGTHKF